MAVLVSGCTAGAGALPWSSEPTELVQVEPRQSPVPVADTSTGVGLAPGNLDEVGTVAPAEGQASAAVISAEVGPRSFVDERGRISATMVWYQRVLDGGVDLDAVAEVNITLIPIDAPGPDTVDVEDGGVDSAAGTDPDGGDSAGSGDGTGYLVQGRVELLAGDTVCRRFEASRDCRVTDLVDADLVGVASRRGNRLVIALDWRRFGPESVSGLPLVGLTALGEQAMSGGVTATESDAVGRALTDSGLIGEFDLSLTIPQARRFHSQVAGSGSGFMELVPVG